MAGTTTVQSNNEGSERVRYDVAYTADAADGSIAPATIPVPAGLLVHFAHKPGSTAPTTGTKFVLADGATGVDALCDGGAVATPGNDWGGPTPGGSSISPVPVAGSLVFSGSGNSVNSASGVFSFYIIRTP